MTILCLPPERPGHSPSPKLQAYREALASAVKAGKYRTAEPTRESVLDGVRVLRFAATSSARAIVVHFHGGGFRIGCPEMTGPFAEGLGTRCNVEFICPAYRLAPEHPLPAALYDGMKVINAMAGAGDHALILSGDSAGGGLATSLCALCVAAGISITALLLLSPWLDLTLASESFKTNAASDALFSYEAASEAAELYLQGASADHPLASPVFGNANGFPPTLISVGSGEVLAGDAERFYLLLKRANVRSRLVVTGGMEHTAPVRDLQSPGAAESFNALARFIDESLAR